MAYGTQGSLYGGFQWGSATPRAGRDESSRGTVPVPDTITAEEAYGSGLKLADNDDIRAGKADYPFDLVVDERGALETVSGLRFLMQGVALKFTSSASRIMGQTWNPTNPENARADLGLDIQKIATNDERVVEVRDVTIAQRPLPDSVSVSMTVVGERAIHDTVFSVGAPPAPP